jgi:hypothetical protein
MGLGDGLRRRITGGYLIKNGLDIKILSNIKSTICYYNNRYFAKEIAKFNKNVFILANAVDPTEKTIHKFRKSERVRIGWLGGSSHLKI